jgi:hypothetical protein
MTPESIVRKKYPTACCVFTLTWLCDEYRIWPTNNPFEVRVLGRGATKDQAWKDAHSNITLRKSKKKR